MNKKYSDLTDRALLEILAERMDNLMVFRCDPAAKNFTEIFRRLRIIEIAIVVILVAVLGANAVKLIF